MGEKDFTSSLPWQQRGTAPALPISGTTSAKWLNAHFSPLTGATDNVMKISNSPTTSVIFGQNAVGQDNLYRVFNENTVDLSSASTFNVADLRLAFQIQKWMERNARAGARYTESLRAHFGVSPRDDRLQRPEYIGGSKTPVIVSEVLQTSSTDATSPQGNMAGHGISVASTFCGKYRATEHGIIMGIMSIMPRTMYQQGFDRSWLRRSRYDFYFPEFANLSGTGGFINARFMRPIMRLRISRFLAIRVVMMRCEQNATWSVARCEMYLIIGILVAYLRLLLLSIRIFVKCVPDKRILRLRRSPVLSCSLLIL